MNRALTRATSASRWRRLTYLSGATLLCAAACGVGAAASEPPGRAVTATRLKPPSAAEFARLFAATANAYATAHHDPARIERPDCVQASPGHYMCSYAAVSPGDAEKCHLMQATWTPKRASTFTVTLAGRTARCRSLRDALESLP